MRRLLIISCSDRKRSSKGKLPAWERYDGVSFRLLKKLQRENAFPKNLDVLILSAKHGLLSPETWIDDYDLKMTAARAFELAPSVSRQLDRLLRREKYADVFVNLGKAYFSALALSEELPKLNLTCAQGGIGSRMKQMKAWIFQSEVRR
ncbi:MAG: hypothetical protein NZM05_00680 [Chloroherpetonaceae bacterium]|nr:hypothetical protein [Chloroherpetonaceae bacterium]